MLTALNNEKKRIHIRDAKDDEKYFCPDCGKLLIAKRGKYRIPHFAHKKGNVDNISCFFSARHKKSKWHIDWQNLYPVENIEIILKQNNQKHIADVIVNNAVIEFQHSHISIEEFRKRNNFYTSLGYQVIWIFDLINEFENKDIKTSQFNNTDFDWKHPKNPFRKMDVYKEKCLIYFQLSNNSNSFELVQVIDNSDNFKHFSTSKDQIFSKKNFLDLSMNDINKLLVKPRPKIKQSVVKVPKTKKIENTTKKEIKKLQEIKNEQKKSSPYSSIFELVGENPSDSEMIVFCTKFNMYFYIKIDRDVWEQGDVICIPYLLDIKSKKKIKLLPPSTYHEFRNSKIWVKVKEED